MSNSNQDKIEVFNDLVNEVEMSMNLVELAFLRLKQLNKHSTEYERMSTLNEFNKCVLARDESVAKLSIYLKQIVVAA